MFFDKQSLKSILPHRKKIRKRAVTCRNHEKVTLTNADIKHSVNFSTIYFCNVATIELD